MGTRWCNMLGAVVMAVPPSTGLAGEVLYNGIVLPDEWPPQITELTRDPLAEPPYLKAPPAVVSIDVGRQLFVDDFLIESTTLTRTHHLAQYYAGNPVLKPDQPWEKSARPPRAAPFSDGVWFDPADRLFKLWYWSGSTQDNPLRYNTCYATSKDGIHWEKPILDVVPGTNVVIHDGEDMNRNSSSMWLDLDEKDPARRYKYFHSMGKEENVLGKKFG